MFAVTRRSAARPIVTLFAVALLAACSSDAREEARLGGIVFSPNGEPLTGGILGRAHCDEALGKWVDKMASGPDHTIKLKDFVDDAHRQFLIMDLNGDGFLTAVELAQYRAPYDFHPRLADDRDTDNRDADNEESRDSDRDSNRNGDQKHLGPRSGHEYNESQPDPVMVADTKMRFKVSLNEFLTYARRHFILLDSNLKGFLTKADVVKTCDERPNR